MMLNSHRRDRLKKLHKLEPLTLVSGPPALAVGGAARTPNHLAVLVEVVDAFIVHIGAEGAVLIHVGDALGAHPGAEGVVLA